MKPFLDEDFLLHSDAAVRLWHEFAKDQPIFDYHCHLPAQEIADNRQFNNMTEIWLEGDHYKWRVLRTAGIDERLITGDASDKDKFMAWASVIPKTIGNPIFHWSHLDLKRPFGLKNIVFSPQTAQQVWDHCQQKLALPEFSARGIMQQMNVKMVGTTDDPLDDLQHHQRIADEQSFNITVLPTWRPDNVFKPELPGFADYIQALSALTDIVITSFNDLTAALTKRLDHFGRHGCRSADHGIEVVRFAQIPSMNTLNTILCRRLDGEILSEIEVAQFSTAIQVWLGKQYAQRCWVMQLHIGAQRNNNERAFRILGVNTGFDSINDRPFAEPLAQLLSTLDLSDELPKTVLYTLNPAWNAVMATMCGNFQGGGIAGKVQFGSGWWFNDQLDGMTRQMEQLAQLGLLSQFIGMLTDSRSFLSYTRHEYFRRLLCNIIGGWIDRGEIPPDFALTGEMVTNICYHNARGYFN
ncbi:glucuronate isomerase [Acerihabitans sp. TG2]|uniref:glucuronate isomerase n=1 Tax=Acerihabitans sp. TG2 TaxID=3096008 RepID=UPI002B22AFDB|nr:glucuronate isomerase [Acerihabitans sp. TG2]MEA9390421.1 glucuronate isomerase [Acerihabitans sp. TG2]